MLVGERGIRGVWCSDNKEIGRGRGRNSRYEHEHEHKHERREHTDGAGMRESGNIRRMINSAEFILIGNRRRPLLFCVVMVWWGVMMESWPGKAQAKERGRWWTGRLISLLFFRGCIY